LWKVLKYYYYYYYYYYYTVDNALDAFLQYFYRLNFVMTSQQYQSTGGYKQQLKVEERIMPKKYKVWAGY